MPLQARRAVLAATGLTLVAAVAWAVTSASVSTGQPSGSQSAGAYTFSYTVAITGYNPDAQPSHKRFKDFHVFPRAGRELNVDSVTKPNGWKSQKGGNGGIVFTKSDGEGNGDYTFELKGKVSGDEKVSGTPCDVVVTHTGARTRAANDDLCTGERSGPTSIKSISAPDFLGYVTPDAWGGTFAAHLGQATTFTICFDSSSMGYRVYHSTTVLDDWSDTLHLGIDSADPVPPEWGLTFSGLTGTLSGGEASMSVTVPNNSELLNRTFFLVATTQIDGVVQGKTYDIAVKIVQ